MNSRKRLANTAAIHSRWAALSKEERTTATAPGLAAFLEKFFDQVDPERTLDPADRAKRAKNVRSMYFARMALEREQAKRDRAHSAAVTDRRAVRVATKIASK